MKTFLSLRLLGLFVGLSLAAAAHADTSWTSDFKQAQQQAKSGNRLLLMDFTGSDWCGWCIKLNKEVFSQPEFKDYATKNLVLMEVDFPRGKVIPTEVKAQNELLAGKFGIQGFPTIVVLNADGKMVGQLGYTEGGPKAFIAQLEKLKKS